MQQRNSTKQFSSRRQKTRNQRQREFIKDAVLVVALAVLWMAVVAYGLKIWAEHPAEQPITYQQHMESIQGGER